VMSVGGVGVLFGGLVMSVWGGPRRRILAMLGFMLSQGFVLGVGSMHRSVLALSVAAFAFLFLFAFIESCSQTLWQSKVAPEVQGRVFSVRRAIGWSSLPLAYGLAGPLADHVFEPLLLPQGLLAATVGELYGVGRGRGAALLLSLFGIVVALTACAGILNPRLRKLEEEVPDALGPLPAPGDAPESPVRPPAAGG
jgi:MFS transporter, DHA3 family, macrolide efflux protein